VTSKIEKYEYTMDLTEVQEVRWELCFIYRAGILSSVTSKIEKYTVDLVEIQEVKWEGIWYFRNRELCFLYRAGH
jgi:hypothetical protein